MKGTEIMPLSPEEAQATGQLNTILENNLSSVKIIHKGISKCIR